MRVLVLGGAGAMARVAIKDLLASEGVERVGLADLRIDAAAASARSYEDERVEPLMADANSPDELVRSMKDWDVVLNSTWYELNLKVMGSAIKAGIHYIDLGGLYHMTLKQMAMAGEAQDAGVACILGLGSSPGVTNLMASVGGAMLESISRVSIRVAGGSQGTAAPSPGGSFNPPYSFRTIMDEAVLPAAVLRGGRIEMVPGMSKKETFVLPDPVGTVEGYLTLHSELATLPQSLGKGVSEMDFVVAFSPAFSASLSLLVSLGLASKTPLDVGRTPVVPYELLMKLVDMMPREKGNPSDSGIRRVEIWGKVRGEDSHLTLDCVSGPHRGWNVGGRALGTGVPASLGAQWLGRGEVRDRGVFPPERSIDAMKFLKELDSHGRGIETYCEDRTGRRRISAGD